MILFSWANPEVGFFIIYHCSFLVDDGREGFSPICTYLFDNNRILVVEYGTGTNYELNLLMGYEI
jgi:hypothetical protein